MATIADLKENLSDLKTFKFISSAFTEAAAVKLRRIREQFERNRRFYEEVTYVYHLIRISAVKQKHKGIKRFVSVKPKILSVAFTSNLRFSGTLNVDIIQKFIKETETLDTTRLVIGKTGIDYLKGINYNKPYQTIIFKVDNPTTEEMRVFLQETRDFDKVLVFYPKFVTLMSQQPDVKDISYLEVSGKEKEEPIDCIFEPELSKMVDFFETQVRTILFQRIMLEIELAKTAARMLTMSAAEERADNGIKETHRDLGKAIRSLMNMKLLETFAGMSKWKR